jgi:predicted regulator of Ras-like GTPase activity (Roadblock/LC7/MglB family)
MTAQLAVAVVSVLGAALFLAAGYFLARSRLRSAGAAAATMEGDEEELGPQRAMLARTTAEFKQVQAQHEAAEKQVATLQLKLDHLLRSSRPAIETSTLKAQVAQLQVALDSADAAKTKLMAEISRLRGEFEARYPHGPSSSAAPVLPVGDLERDGASIEHYLERLCERGGARGAVVADDSGLVVAGAGLGVEALAALAATSLKYSANATDLISMGPVSMLTISDGTELTFTTVPIRVGSGTAILATLSTGSIARETLAPVLHRARAMLD